MQMTFGLGLDHLEHVERNTARATSLTHLRVGRSCRNANRNFACDLSVADVPPPQICRADAVAGPYPRANAPRNSAESGNVNSANAATSAKACHTPSTSPTRPNRIGAIAPEPITPV